MIVNTIASYNVNASSYNATTGIWQFSYNPTPLATGIYCGTFSNVGAVLPTGYSLTAVYFLFFYSGVGGGFGLANSYANAVAEVPVIFTTGGSGSLVFKKQGGNYTLQARVPDCCDQPYFNGLDLIANKWAKSVTVTVSGWVRNAHADSPSPYFDAGDLTTTLGLVNTTFTLYTQGGGSSLPFYSNSKHQREGGAGVDLFITYDAFVVTYTLVVEAVFTGRRDTDEEIMITGYGGGYYSGTRTITYADFNNILSGSVSLGLDYAATGTDVYFTPGSVTSLNFSSNFEAEVMPSTLTLTKKPGTHLTELSSAYPTRGWTTNNYESELPDTITLNKVAGHDNYEAEFTTADNVMNYIRLKLGNWPVYGYPNAGWSYSCGNPFDALGSIRFYFLLSENSGYGIRYNGDISIQRGDTTSLLKVLLFRMEGIPLLTSSGYVVSKCKGFANYYLETP